MSSLREYLKNMQNIDLKKTTKDIQYNLFKVKKVKLNDV